jgi:hypothetical protein
VLASAWKQNFGVFEFSSAEHRREHMPRHVEIETIGISLRSPTAPFCFCCWLKLAKRENARRKRQKSEQRQEIQSERL